MEKYVFARIQHIIFCLKSKSGMRRRESKKRDGGGHQKEDVKEKIKSRG